MTSTPRDIGCLGWRIAWSSLVWHHQRSLALDRNFSLFTFKARKTVWCQSLSASGSIDRVRFRQRGQVVAEHPRCWGKAQVIFEPLHYLALLERKPGGLDYARPLAGLSLPGAFTTL